MLSSLGSCLLPREPAQLLFRNLDSLLAEDDKEGKLGFPREEQAHNGARADGHNSHPEMHNNDTQAWRFGGAESLREAPDLSYPQKIDYPINKRLEFETTVK